MPFDFGEDFQLPTEKKVGTATWGDVGRQFGASAIDLATQAASAGQYAAEQSGSMPNAARIMRGLSRLGGAASDSVRENITEGGKRAAEAEFFPGPGKQSVFDAPGSAAWMKAAGAVPGLAAIGGAAAMSGGLGAAGAGTALQLGQVIDQTQRLINSMDDSELTEKIPAYSQLRSGGMDEEKARTALAGLMVTNTDLAAGAAAGALGAIPMGRALTGAAGGILNSGVNAAVGMALGAGQADYARQSGGVAAGMQDEIDYVEVARTTANAAAEGGVLGGVMGAAQRQRAAPGTKSPPPLKPRGKVEKVDAKAPDAATTQALTGKTTEEIDVEAKPQVKRGKRAKETPSAEAPPATTEAPKPPVTETGNEAPPAGERPKVEDAGLTVPEKPVTFKEQIAQLVAGDRAAVLIPKGAKGRPTQPEGMKKVTTKEGTFYYDPERIKPKDIYLAIKEDRLNEILELGPVSKTEAMARQEQGEAPVAVTERTPDGAEVKAAAGTEETAPRQVDALEGSKTEGNTVQVEPVEQVLADRAAPESTLTPAEAPIAEAPQESAGTAPPTGYTTAKGSTYVVHEDGTTTRDKAARPEHPGDSGQKPRSARTVYVDPTRVAGLAPPQGDWRMVDHGDGTLTLVWRQSPDRPWGASPSARNIPVETTPREGLIPVELWSKETIQGLDAYGNVHFGNSITEVRSTPRAEAEAPKAPEPPVTPPVTPSEAPTPAAKVAAVKEKAKKETKPKEPTPAKQTGPTPEQLADVESSVERVRAVALENGATPEKAEQIVQAQRASRLEQLKVEAKEKRTRAASNRSGEAEAGHRSADDRIANNKLAQDAVDTHPPGETESDFASPDVTKRRTARAAIVERLTAMLAKAKEAGWAFGESGKQGRIKDNVDERRNHGPATIALVEADRLLRRIASGKAEVADFLRYASREAVLRTGDRESVVADRRAEGLNTRAKETSKASEASSVGEEAPNVATVDTVAGGDDQLGIGHSEEAFDKREALRREAAEIIAKEAEGRRLAKEQAEKAKAAEEDAKSGGPTFYKGEDHTGSFKTETKSKPKTRPALSEAERKAKMEALRKGKASLLDDVTDPVTGEQATPQQTLSAREMLDRLKLDNGKGLSGGLARAIRNAFMRVIPEDLQVHILDSADFDRLTGSKTASGAYLDGDQGKPMIVVRDTRAGDDARMQHIVLHEATHAVMQEALRRSLDLRNAVRDIADVTADWLKTNGSPAERKALEYALRQDDRGLINPHEFLAEAFSNSRVQSALAQIEAPKALLEQLGYGNKKPASLFDAVKAMIRRALEKLPFSMPKEAVSMMELSLHIGDELIYRSGVTPEGKSFGPESIAFKRWFGESKVVHGEPDLNDTMERTWLRRDLTEVESFADGWKSNLKRAEEAAQRRAQPPAKRTIIDRVLRRPAAETPNVMDSVVRQARENYEKYNQQAEEIRAKLTALEDKIARQENAPRVVYHGVGEGGLEIQQFLKEKLGSKTQAASAFEGFFFAGKPSTSEAYLPHQTDTSQTAYYESFRETLLRDLMGWDGKAPITDEMVRAALMDPPKSTKPFTDAERAWAEEHYQDLRDTLQTVENNIRKAQAGGVIQPAYLRMENPLIHDMGGQHYRETTYYDLIKKAKAEGHDGVIIKNTFDGGPMDDIFVVFEPEQIKSASSNAGTYDPKDARISFLDDDGKPTVSRAAEAMARQASDTGINLTSLGKKVINKVRSLDNMARAADRIFGGADNNPIRKIQETVETIRVAAQKNLEASEPLIKKMDQLQRKHMASGQWELFTELQHDANMLNVHPDVDLKHARNKHVGTGIRDVQSRLGHADLAERFAKLDPELQGLWREATSYYAGQQNTLAQKLLTNHLMKALVKKGAQEREAIAQRFFDGKETEADIKEIGQNAYDALKDVNELRRLKGPYFPQMRRGDFVVTAEVTVAPPKDGKVVGQDAYAFDETRLAADFARDVWKKHGLKATVRTEYYDPETGKTYFTDADGAQVKASKLESDAAKRFVVDVPTRYVSFHETMAEAQRHAADLSGQDGFAKADASPRRFEQSGRSVDLLSSQMRALMARVEGGKAYKELTDAEKDAFKQALDVMSLQMLGSTRVQSRRMPRNFIQGASRDVTRNTLDYAQSMAAHLAKLDHQPTIDEALIKARDMARDGTRNADRTEILNEVEQRLAAPEYVASNTSPAMNRILQMSFLDKLFSPAYNLINMTQPIVNTVPLLAARHGWGATTSAMTRAYSIIGGGKNLAMGAANTVRAAKGKDTADILTSMRDRLGKAGEQYVRLFDYLEGKGAIGSEAGLEVAKSIRRADGVMGKVDAGLNYADAIARALPEAIETNNRMASAVAAFDLELKKGAGEDAAMRKALDVVNQTQFNYSATNAPTFMKHPLAKVFFQFKKYAQGQYQFLGEQIATALKDANPAARKEAAKVLMNHALMVTAFAGAVGLPTEPIKALLLATAPVTGFSMADFDREIEKLMPEVLSRGLSRGIPGGFAFDLSGRMGENSMLTFGTPKSYKSDDVKAWLFDNLKGAPAGLIEDWISGVNGLLTGDSSKQVESVGKLIPIKVFSDTLDAYRKATEGKTNARGQEKMAPYSPQEAMVRAIGFTPAREANTRAAQSYFYDKARELKDERSELTNAYLKGKTGDERTKAWAKIAKWNAAQPAESRITREQLTKQEKSDRKAEQSGKLVNGVRVTKQNERFLSEGNQLYGVR